MRIIKGIDNLIMGVINFAAFVVGIYFYVEIQVDYCDGHPLYLSFNNFDDVVSSICIIMLIIMSAGSLYRIVRFVAKLCYDIKKEEDEVEEDNERSKFVETWKLTTLN